MRLSTIVVVTAIVASAGTAVAQSTNAQGSSANHRGAMKTLMDHYVEVYNSHDLSRLTEVLTEDSINVSPLGTMTLPELAAAMEGFILAFPDLTYSVESVIVDGNRVVLEYTYTGTNTGELWGAPATNVVVYGRGLEIHYVEDGRIVHTDNYSDVFGLFAQLGML